MTLSSSVFPVSKNALSNAHAFRTTVPHTCTKDRSASSPHVSDSHSPNKAFFGLSLLRYVASCFPHLFFFRRLSLLHLVALSSDRRAAPHVPHVAGGTIFDRKALWPHESSISIHSPGFPPWTTLSLRQGIHGIPIYHSSHQQSPWSHQVLGLFVAENRYLSREIGPSHLCPLYRLHQVPRQRHHHDFRHHRECSSSA